MSNKVEIKNGLITEENGSFFAKYNDEETEQELKANLTDKIREFLNVEGINFKLGKGRKSGSQNRKPTFTYECGCGKLIKSTEEELEIMCKACGKDFIKQE